jgi:hypothetical protein
VKKARDGDPYEWVADRFYADMGGDQYSGGPDSLSPIPPSVNIKKDDELNELARLAGLEESSCNMTAEGQYCEVHGMNECGMSMYEAKGKPDFLDLDKDGDKKEPMKKAVKDKELDESKPDFLDMDKDGDKEEPMKKAIGDKRNPFARTKTSNAFTQTAPYPSFKKKNPVSNKKEELDECDMPSNMSPMANGTADGQNQDSGMSVSTSIDTRTGRKTINISADGETAEQIAQILKMAGLSAHQHAHAEQPQVVAIGEEFANQPEPEYKDADAIFSQGGDLNKKKKQDPKTANKAANPLKEEDNEIVERLRSMYNRF